MLNYIRKIAYVHYYENDDKQYNTGFIKIELLEKRLKISIAVKDTKKKESGNFKIYGILENGVLTDSLGTLTMTNGIGISEKIFQEKTLQDEHIDMHHMIGIRFHREGKGYRQALWGEVNSGSEVKPDVKDAVSKITQEKYIQDTTHKIKEEQSMQDILNDIKENTKDTLHASQEHCIRGQQRQRTDNYIQHNRYHPQTESNTQHQENADAWHIWKKMYPVYHPYGKNLDIEGIMLQPENLNILKKQYHKYLANSFLIHGYMNYGYICVQKENKTYYLAIPGIYHEKEKMVADMFGFSVFSPENENCQIGSFGYYKKEISLN